MPAKEINILIILLSVSGLLGAQTARRTNPKIDSIKAVCEGLSENKQLVDNLNKISTLFEYTDTDSSLFYAQKALSLADKLNYKYGTGEALFSISYCYDQSGEWESAIDNLEDAITIFKELKDTTYLIGCTLNIGLLYSYGADLVKGLEYTIEAKEMSEERSDKYALPEAYTNIGWFYEYLDEFRSAHNYYTKALEITREKDKVDFICILNIGLGYVNIKLHKLDEALKNLKRAQELLPKIEDKHLESEIIMLFATYFLETNNLSEAEKNLKKAALLITQLNFERLRPDLYYAKGKLSFKQGKYKEALDNFDNALKYCEQLKKYDVLKDILEDKAEVYAQLGQYENAYRMVQRKNQADELIQPNKIAQVLGEFEHKEQLKEQKAQAQLQEKLEEEQNKTISYRERVQLQITAFSTIILVIVVIVLSYYVVLKKKHSKILSQNYNTINKQKLLLERNIDKLAENEQNLKRLNATKDKFFSIIAHDLKNPFNVLIGISDLIRTNSDIKHSKEFEKLVEGMFQTATSGYNLLENLLEWSRTQTDSIQFDAKDFAFSEILETNKTIFEQAANAKRIQISWPEENDHIVFADYNMVNFIIRNLLNNAVKFSQEDGKIEVSTHVEDQMLVCAIRDHGIGIDKDTLSKLFKIEYSVQRDGTSKEKGTGLGLILCKEFIEKNEGQIRVKSEPGKGSTFSFSLPLSKA